MLDTFKKANIKFSYSMDSVVPEIPRVKDVLYVLTLSEMDENYLFCVGNHSTYVVNVGLVMAAVGSEVLCMEPYDVAEANKIVAQAIVDLCPDEAKCLFNGAYTEAMRLSGHDVLPEEGVDRQTRIRLCDCPRHTDKPKNDAERKPKKVLCSRDGSITGITRPNGGDYKRPDDE